MRVDELEEMSIKLHDTEQELADLKAKHELLKEDRDTWKIHAEMRKESYQSLKQLVESFIKFGTRDKLEKLKQAIKEE